MTRPVASSLSPRQFVELLVEYRKLWLVPMVVATVLAIGYSVVMPRNWKATQGLLVRPEVAGLGNDRLGKFGDLSEMKTLQETLLELARSKSVVTKVLQEVGPPANWKKNKAWPTAQDVVDFRDAMVMNPPGGAEFGKTEVFYLGVLDQDPERAADLTSSLAAALEQRTQEIRQGQADSMIAELANGVSQAVETLTLKTNELSEFEGSVGADLNDLRNLLNPIGGASESSQDNLAIQAELRAIRSEREQNEKLLEVLQKAQKDPQMLVATPATLLASQPAVDRLKQGVIDAQLNTARLLGTLAPAHPYVLAAQEAESHVREQLHRELATAIQGLQIELEVSQQRQAALKQQLVENQDRQRGLARHRAVYAQLVAAVDNQTQLVDAAQTRLAEAQSHLAGAQSASLLSRIDHVESGIKPVGPGRATVVGVGGLLGLMLGLGIVFVKHGPRPMDVAELEATPATVAGRTEFGFASPRSHRFTLSEAIATGYEARETAGAH
ncbi:GumC family protein [Aeoliella mucimassa]|uniref:Chain length determinant protein n=1 Tax=Aeoliella mucimassa TaxID=2527972 RepID=A0A518ANZ6_9BACT|nr:hypothetical protein [Aeoliella mucimassa]QDU56449.1 Chain length determinant protein [Aeoliella mucimassa]